MQRRAGISSTQLNAPLPPPPPSAEGTNSALKLHRLRGDIHDHMEAAHHAAAAAAHAATNSGTEYEYDGGFKADGGLALAFDDFYASLWPQVRG